MDFLSKVLIVVAIIINDDNYLKYPWKNKKKIEIKVSILFF